MPQLSPSDFVDRLFAIPELVLVILAVVMAAREVCVLFVRERAGVARARAVATNVFTGALQSVASVAGLALWLPLFTAVFESSPLALPVALWVVPLAILVVDFFDYWSHRASHASRTLWAIGHSVHHSANHFDASVGLRVSFVESLVMPAFYLPAAALLHPAVLVGALGFTLLYQQWVHTEHIGRLGWFDRWFDSPSNHRVHHGANAAYVDRNFGSLTMLWDRMFGTYATEQEPPVYGLTPRLGSNHPWDVHTAELRRWIAEVRGAPPRP
ncbi:MAG: sterol desaturase family protein [Deltaproteobacteria bacterium]|nr:sterol desaturase family protein [Nannocystaceae bacterium]